MRILFASGNGYLPEFSGGVQSSTDHLVRECRAAGHEAAVLASLFGDGLFGIGARLKMKLTRSPVATDRKLGYPVMRAWFPWEAAAHVARGFRPDVALVQCHRAVRIGHAFAAMGVPLVLYMRNVEFEELEGDPSTLPNARFIANSEFTARRYHEAFGIGSTVVPPTIEFAKYAFPTTRECVAFVNVDPKKGFERAVELARACPDIPFLFVEGWMLEEGPLAAVKAVLDPLPNVTFLRRTDDMRQVYGRARILLAPSKWEEAWGRVASEAHCSGIPVLGSSRGGLPEAIGPGGTVLDYDAPTAEWVAALRRLWDDKDFYAEKSAAALDYAKRPQLDSASQVRTVLSVLEQAARSGRATAA